MSRFIIFFCGTSSSERDYNKKHVFHQGELVSSLAKNAQGFVSRANEDIKQGLTYLKNKLKDEIRAIDLRLKQLQTVSSPL